MSVGTPQLGQMRLTGSGSSPLPALASHSRFVQRIRRRYADDLVALAPGVPDGGSIRATVEGLQARGRDLPAALRVARQLVLERLACLDVEAQLPLAQVTAVMTTLAEVTLEAALVRARTECDQRHGRPVDAQGREIDFWVVGMGKLGARELNVSSDIDLVYVYEEDGQTQGPVDPGAAVGRGGPVSAHEYFALLAKRLYALIGETTEDGFVFRMDLALRPNGNSGPSVVSLSMLEEYFQVQGREWERFAWLKSRVVAPRAAVDSGRANALRSLVTPFVYRKYLDYGVFEGLRQLHRKIREEAQRRAAGRPERANDVKLSRGGIREIEFIVQLMLVARGGHFPEIRTRSTLRGLERLVARGLMKPATAGRLGQAYELLRRIEHRIQYLDDQQTHLLPTADGDLDWIARALDPQGSTDACALLEQLGEAREFVANEFDALLRDGSAAPAGGARPGCRTCGQGPLPIDSPSLIERLPDALAERVRRWVAQPRVAGLREDSKLRLGRLIQRSEAGVADGSCTLDAALRFVDWLDPLLRREAYFTLLVERPEVQRRLLRLLGLARWPMQYLMRHPGVIDELADERLLGERFDREVFLRELEERHAAWVRGGQADEEALLDTLRRAHHAEVFRTLVRDVEGRLSVEEVADELSALADAVMDAVLRWSWANYRLRHRPQPALAVIAYGKLGGKELGYGSDLDVVFVYDDRDESDADRAQEIYAAFVRKVITWLTLRTAHGDLYEIDTALRPNGSSGLLVTSIDAFERYQVGRGSNTAWTWEHQALTRARFCAGHEPVATRFEAMREKVLTAPRDPQALLSQVSAMREKVRAAHAVPSGRFDVKHSPGGMIDAEFAVQALVLTQCAAHPTLTANVGNIALLRRTQQMGLLPPGVGDAAADAYRALRSAQHRARLDEQATHFEADAFALPRDAILAVWRHVFSTTASAATVD
jgi:[glutamine synthetase] adenylyltransferase / [glutamine synthetase]-adenylyl-L-tyrosine phosphorylase